jgi:hypothetical protein
MIWRIICGLLLSSVGLAQGQPTYWEEYVGQNGITELIYSTCQSPEGEAVFVSRGVDYFTETPKTRLTFYRSSSAQPIDVLGEIEFQEETVDLIQLIPNTQGYLGVGGIRLTDSTGAHTFVAAYDESGDSLWTKTYILPGKNAIGFGIQNAANGDILVCGQSVLLDGSDADMMLLRLSPSGDLLWSGFYGVGHDAGNRVLEFDNGDLVVFGQSQDPMTLDIDIFAVWTDENGVEQNQEYYGGSGNFRVNDAIVTQDSSIVIAGGGNSRGVIIKTSLTGSIIWQEFYHPSIRAFIYDIEEHEDGGFAAAGLSRHADGSDAGYFLRIDSEGNTEYHRQYNPTIDTELIRGITTTPDSGYLMVGFGWNIDSTSQDGWVLKVDSVGCEYPECITGIDETDKTVLVDLWPNPTSNFLNLKFHSTNRQTEIRVLNMQGQEMNHSIVSSPSTVLDVSEWPVGLYIMYGQDENGGRFSLRFVKD